MQVRAILNPSTYHGTHQKPPFFEGWYFKMVSADEKHKIAIIPGVILGKDAHAFVQVIDGSDASTEYFTFPIEQFQADFPHFRVGIGANQFDSSHLSVNIQQPEGQLVGEVSFGKLIPWPVTFFSPGVMGWFSWVPKMECYHGVLSFDHSLQGKLTLNGKEMDFTGGRGYIEKDWGKVSLRRGFGFRPIISKTPLPASRVLLRSFPGWAIASRASSLVSGWTVNCTASPPIATVRSSCSKYQTTMSSGCCATARTVCASTPAERRAGCCAAPPRWTWASA